MPKRLRGLGWLYVAFTLALLSFLASAVYCQVRIAEIDKLAYDISENAAPSIEYLASARAELQIMLVVLGDYVDNSFGAPSVAVGLDDVRRVRSDVDRDIGAYLALPVFPGERELWEGVRRDLTHVDDAVQRVFDAVARRDEGAANHELYGSVRGAVETASASILVTIEFDARHAHDSAIQIARSRARIMWHTAELDAVSAIMTVVVALLAVRAMRRFDDLSAAHTALLERRAAELEQFAGRVAHDILSPLGAVSLGIRVADVGDAERRSNGLRRVERALSRVQRIVEGLLDFARSGANPEPDVRTDVREIIEDVEGEMRAPASEANIELTVEPCAPVAVACSPGVLTSLVSNLVRNAIKYMGDAVDRRIMIRVVEKATSVRVEVEDTGPGLPPDLETRVFDPYVRASGNTQPGIGIGLATVRRMAEAHGGASGVRSTAGRGCLFWFELPRSID